MRRFLTSLIGVVALAMMIGTAGADGLASLSPVQIVVQLAAAVRGGDSAPVDAWLTAEARVDLAALEREERADGKLAALGSPIATSVAARTEKPDGTTLLIAVACSGGMARWTITFNDAQGLLSAVTVETVATAPAVVQQASRAQQIAAEEAAQAQAQAERESLVVAEARENAAVVRQKQAAAIERAREIETQEEAITVPAPRVAPAADAASAASSPFTAPSALRYHHAFGKPHLPPRPVASASRTIVAPQPAAQPDARSAAIVLPAPAPAAPTTGTAEVAAPAAAATTAPVVAAPPASDVVDARTVEFLLATTRRADTGDTLRFTADRSDSLLYGVVRVHVPLDHKAGHVERPWSFSPAGFTLYEEKLDEKKHFVVTGARLIGAADFFRFATGDPRKEALVFVHGFNNTFEDSAYRFAQILFDLQYARPAILFSWASKGSAVDYLYDKDSAEEARDRFATLIRTLQSNGVEKINVIAHSMGNYLAVAALADSVQSANPDRVEQLIMAAPDISRDYLSLEAPKLAKIAHAVTLYACATDRALQLSKDAAGGVPRAGDVPPDGPLVLPGIDTIDVSLLGGDWFGLNHDVFASNRSVMDDIFALLKEEKSPPRLAQVRGMPDGVVPPRFWRFEP